MIVMLGKPCCVKGKCGKDQIQLFCNRRLKQVNPYTLLRIRSCALVGNLCFIKPSDLLLLLFLCPEQVPVGGTFAPASTLFSLPNGTLYFFMVSTTR